MKAGLAAGAFVCCFMGCFGLVGRHIDRSRLSGQFPITHWIMMGLNEQSGGEFSRSDEAYTMSYPDQRKKKWKAGCGTDQGESFRNGCTGTFASGGSEDVRSMGTVG